MSAVFLPLTGILPFVPEKCECSGKAAVHSMLLDDQHVRIVVTAEAAGEMTIRIAGTGSKCLN